MHGQYYRIVILALELGGHVTYGHVEGRFGGSVCGKAVFQLKEVAVRARVGRHEGDGSDGDVCLEKLLGADDGSDGVGVD